MENYLVNLESNSQLVRDKSHICVLKKLFVVDEYLREDYAFLYT